MKKVIAVIGVASIALFGCSEDTTEKENNSKPKKDSSSDLYEVIGEQSNSETHITTIKDVNTGCKYIAIGLGASMAVTPVINEDNYPVCD